MMKMRKEDFYRIILDETIHKWNFNPNFIAVINSYNVGKKKEILLKQYNRLNVSEKKYGVKRKKVYDCPDEAIHSAFERIFNKAVDWEKKNLEKRVDKNEKQADMFKAVAEKSFNRHLEALDGYPSRAYHKRRKMGDASGA